VVWKVRSAEGAELFGLDYAPLHFAPLALRIKTGAQFDTIEKHFLCKTDARSYASKSRRNNSVCETSNGNNVQIQSWVDKYRTGSGSNRVEHASGLATPLRHWESCLTPRPGRYHHPARGPRSACGSVFVDSLKAVTLFSSWRN
jgi:hypothetical protein